MTYWDISFFGLIFFPCRKELEHFHLAYWFLSLTKVKLYAWQFLDEHSMYLKNCSVGFSYFFYMAFLWLPLLRYKIIYRLNFRFLKKIEKGLFIFFLI